MRGERRVLLEARALRPAALPVRAGLRGDGLVAVAAIVAGELSTDGRGRPAQARRDGQVRLTGRDVNLDLDAFGQRQRFAWHAGT